jgi:hypothetical protein
VFLSGFYAKFWDVKAGIYWTLRLSACAQKFFFFGVKAGCTYSKSYEDYRLLGVMPRNFVDSNVLRERASSTFKLHSLEMKTACPSKTLELCIRLHGVMETV